MVVKTVYEDDNVSHTYVLISARVCMSQLLLHVWFGFYGQGVRLPFDGLFQAQHNAEGLHVSSFKAVLSTSLAIHINHACPKPTPFESSLSLHVCCVGACPQGKESCGFTSRMGGRGAVPRLLRLKPEDAAKTGGKPFAKGSGGCHSLLLLFSCVLFGRFADGTLSCGAATLACGCYCA